VQRYRDYIIFVGDADAIYFLSPDGIEQFRIINPGWYNFTFLISDDVMYFATGPRVEFIGPFDITRREFLWFFDYHDMNAVWYSFSAVSGDLLFMGTANPYGGTLLGYHAYNRNTGELVWRQYLEGVFSSRNYQAEWEFFWRNADILDFMAPTVWRDYVIFTGGDSTARAFDANTGRLRWEHNFDVPVSSPPTIANGRVYFGILGNDFYPPKLICLSARDGSLLWEMETEGAILSAPVIAGRRVIFGTDRSVFYVLEQIF
jgi:outer membrane protein assembly factor BamB